MDRQAARQSKTLTWDDAAFVARVEKLAAAQGRTVRQVCDKAGLAADYLNTPANKKGRAIGGIMQIANELGVSILDLIEPEQVAGQAIRAIDPDTLGRLSLTAHIAAHLYLSLDTRHNIPAPRDAERIVRLIIDLLDLPPRDSQSQKA